MKGKRGALKRIPCWRVGGSLRAGCYHPPIIKSWLCVRGERSLSCQNPRQNRGSARVEDHVEVLSSPAFGFKAPRGARVGNQPAARHRGAQKLVGSHQKLWIGGQLGGTGSCCELTVLQTGAPCLYHEALHKNDFFSWCNRMVLISSFCFSGTVWILLQSGTRFHRHIFRLC